MAFLNLFKKNKQQVVETPVKKEEPKIEKFNKYKQIEDKLLRARAACFYEYCIRMEENTSESMAKMQKQAKEFLDQTPEIIHILGDNNESLIEKLIQSESVLGCFNLIMKNCPEELFKQYSYESEPLCFLFLKTNSLSMIKVLRNYAKGKGLDPVDVAGKKFSSLAKSAYIQCEIQNNKLGEVLFKRFDDARIK